MHGLKNVFSLTQEKYGIKLSRNPRFKLNGLVIGLLVRNDTNNLINLSKEKLVPLGKKYLLFLDIIREKQQKRLVLIIGVVKAGKLVEVKHDEDDSQQKLAFKVFELPCVNKLSKYFDNSMKNTRNKINKETSLILSIKKTLPKCSSITNKINWEYYTVNQQYLNNADKNLNDLNESKSSTTSQEDMTEMLIELKKKQFNNTNVDIQKKIKNGFPDINEKLSEAELIEIKNDAETYLKDIKNMPRCFYNDNNNAEHDFQQVYRESLEMDGIDIEHQTYNLHSDTKFHINNEKESITYSEKMSDVCSASCNGSIENKSSLSQYNDKIEYEFQRIYKETEEANKNGIVEGEAEIYDDLYLGTINETPQAKFTVHTNDSRFTFLNDNKSYGKNEIGVIVSKHLEAQPKGKHYKVYIAAEEDEELSSIRTENIEKLAQSLCGSISTCTINDCQHGDTIDGLETERSTINPCYCVTCPLHSTKETKDQIIQTDEKKLIDQMVQTQDTPKMNEISSLTKNETTQTIENSTMVMRQPIKAKIIKESKIEKVQRKIDTVKDVKIQIPLLTPPPEKRLKDVIPKLNITDLNSDCDNNSQVSSTHSHNPSATYRVTKSWIHMNARHRLLREYNDNKYNKNKSDIPIVTRVKSVSTVKTTNNTDNVVDRLSKPKHKTERRSTINKKEPIWK